MPHSTHTRVAIFAVALLSTLLYANDFAPALAKGEAVTQEDLKELSRRIDGIYERQKMWEEMQHRSNKNWIELQSNTIEKNNNAIESKLKSAKTEYKLDIEKANQSAKEYAEQSERHSNITLAACGVATGFFIIATILSTLSVAISHSKHKKDIETSKENAISLINEIKNDAIKTITRMIDTIKSCEYNATQSMSKIENLAKSAELITNSIQSKVIATSLTTEEDISNYMEEGFEKKSTQTEHTKSTQKLAGLKIDNEIFFSLREEELRKKYESNPEDIATLDEYGIVTSILSAISSSPDMALSYATKSLQTYKKLTQITITKDYYIRLTNAASMLADLESSEDRKIEILNETLETLDNALERGIADEDIIIGITEICYNIGTFTDDNNSSRRHLLRALEMADKALELSPNNTRAHYLAGLAAREIATTRNAHDENFMMQKCIDHFKRVTESNTQGLTSSKLMQAHAYAFLSQLNPTEKKLHNLQCATNLYREIPTENAPSHFLVMYPLSLLNLYHISPNLTDKKQILSQAETILLIAEQREPGKHLYNLACVRTLQGHYDEAIKMIEQAASSGKPSAEHILTDPDLTALHNHPKFQDLISKISELPRAAPEQPTQA